MKRVLKIKTVYQLGMYQVRLQSNGSLEYDRTGEKREYVTPSESAWERFARSCERIGVRKWKSDYTSEDYDGGFWSIEIDFDGLYYKGNGDGAFPVGFRVFCSAVSRLLGGLKFA
jgi:hypothetical protein